MAQRLLFLFIVLISLASRAGSEDNVVNLFSPKESIKLYQFRILIQCEFKPHLHQPLKKQAFHWDVVGVEQGKGMTDKEGRATVSITTPKSLSYIDITVNEKKYHYGPYQNVVVNLKDCEI